MLLLPAVLCAAAVTDLARTATASASSYYATPPYADSFLPAFAIDGDASTAWSSDGDGCAATYTLTLAEAASVATVCARSRDMVDDPAAPHTDDSVIESYDVFPRRHARGARASSPDWRAVYCCTLDAAYASNVTLAAKDVPRGRRRAGQHGASRRWKSTPHGRTTLARSRR